jgi:hypothetical protein
VQEAAPGRVPLELAPVPELVPALVQVRVRVPRQVVARPRRVPRAAR